MDLSAPALFLYMLIVVTLYSSPFVLIALIVGWRKGALAKTAKVVVIGLPILALLAQASFYLDLRLFSQRLASDQAFYDETFPNEVSVYPGRIVGYRQLNDFTYTRYQFDVDPLMPNALEIVLPPANVTSAASVKKTRPKEALPGTGPAQLVIRNAGSYYTPQNETPKTYFGEHYPDLAGYITDDPLLILTLHRGDNSSVNKFIGLDAKYPWRSQMASVDL